MPLRITAYIYRLSYSVTHPTKVQAAYASLSPVVPCTSDSGAHLWFPASFCSRFPNQQIR